jgi:hypothetical protein
MRRNQFKVENHITWRVAAACLLALISVTVCIGQQSRRLADPTRGFDPYPDNGSRTASPGLVSPTKSFDSPTVFLLPHHGNVNGGTDRGYSNVGIIFGARIYGDNLVKAIELFYYVPSGSDMSYREGDYRASTGRIGSEKAGDLGGYYCPEGYAAVGLQGAAGLGVDRLGLVCGKIGELSRVTFLPVLGGRGGNPFRDTCDRTWSSGFLTGVRVRSGLWMDSIEGLCQATK